MALEPSKLRCCVDYYVFLANSYVIAMRKLDCSSELSEQGWD